MECIKNYNRQSANCEVVEEFRWLKAVMDNLPVGVFLANAEGKIFQTNALAQEIWRGSNECLHQEKVAGYEVYKGWWADSGELLKAEDWAMARALKYGQTSLAEVINIERFDGSRGTILNSASPVRDSGGNIIGGIAISQDISKQYLLEEELKQHRNKLQELVKEQTYELINAQERLERFFTISTDIFCILDLDGYFIMVNPSFKKLLGYELSEFMEKSFIEFIHPEDKKITLKESNKVLKGIALKNFENRYLTKDGSYKWISWAVTTILEEKVVYCVGRDITEIKRINQEIARLDSMNLIGQMAGGIGHEVRNPMTTVRGFLQLLMNKEVYREDYSYFELMIEELDRANSIITEFLSLAHDKAVSLRPKSLNKVLRKMYPLLNASALKEDKIILMELTEIPLLEVDTKEIRQLIHNLVGNGLEAMSPGGKLTIKTYLEEGRVVLAVTDEGCGIPEELLNKLGTPFMTTKESGTGLGLSICYRIAQRHQAKIEVESSPQGTTFYLRFTNR